MPLCIRVGAERGHAEGDARAPVTSVEGGGIERVALGEIVSSP